MRKGRPQQNNKETNGQSQRSTMYKTVIYLENGAWGKDIKYELLCVWVGGCVCAHARKQVNACFLETLPLTA